MAVAWAKLAADDAHNGKIHNLVGESKSQPELVAYVDSTCCRPLTVLIHWKYPAAGNGQQRLKSDPA